MRLHLTAATIGLALLTWLNGSVALADTPQTDEPDYDVPNGHFFTEGVSQGQQQGHGFAVFDGDGAALWTAFQSDGGQPQLGYPTSRRFELNDNVAQAFSNAVLVWNRAQAQADVVQLSNLGLARPPAYALQPEQPPVAAATVEQAPWSGWWWPARSGFGPTLFQPDGPLDKYDRYVESTGANDPATRDWERNNVYFPNTSWAGHCNGFAAAALLEPEPTGPVTLNGITFTVADLKGLLVDFNFADAATWSFGDDDGGLSPADFHRMLLDWVASTNTGFAVSFDLGGGQTWSYPLVRFESEWAPDAIDDGVWHVTTTVWLADMDVPANFVGTSLYPSEAGKVFTYDLYGDPRHPSDGVWTGSSSAAGFAHPGRIWYPKAGSRAPGRELISPALDRQTLDSILAGG